MLSTMNLHCPAKVVSYLKILNYPSEVGNAGYRLTLPVEAPPLTTTHFLVYVWQTEGQVCTTSDVFGREECRSGLPISKRCPNTDHIWPSHKHSPNGVRNEKSKIWYNHFKIRSVIWVLNKEHYLCTKYGALSGYKIKILVGNKDLFGYI